MITGEPSYFDFLMNNRCLRRTRVPFAQAVGVMPERMRVVRSRVPRRMRPLPPDWIDRGFGHDIKLDQ